MEFDLENCQATLQHVPTAGTFPASSPANAAFIRRMLRLRSARIASSMSMLFEWPSWDMLLDLAAASLEGYHVSVSSLCVSTGAPQSTALRKLALLESSGFIIRYIDHTDRRRTYLALTKRAALIVQEALAEDLAIHTETKPNRSARLGF